MENIMKLMLILSMVFVLASCATTKHQHEEGSHYDHTAHNHHQLDGHTHECEGLAKND